MDKKIESFFFNLVWDTEAELLRFHYVQPKLNFSPKDLPIDLSINCLLQNSNQVYILDS